MPERRTEVALCISMAGFNPTKENVRNLSAFFSTLEREEFRIAWEPRGSSPHDLIRELRSSLGCVDPFKDDCLSKGAIYFRLHGIGGYRYRCNDNDLRTLLSMCEGKEGYVMFNNLAMKEDALRFIACLNQKERAL